MPQWDRSLWYQKNANSKAQVCCFLGFRNREIRGISNDYILGELKEMMPKGRKERYTLELSGCTSTVQTIGSSYSYLCSPLPFLFCITKCSFMDAACSSEALSHSSTSNLLVPNTNSPQSFKSSDSAIYGVILKTQTVKCSSLKKERGEFLFSKPCFAAFTAELLKSLCLWGGSELQPRLLRTSLRWRGSVWNPYSSYLSNLLKIFISGGIPLLWFGSKHTLKGSDPKWILSSLTK